MLVQKCNDNRSVGFFRLTFDHYCHCEERSDVAIRSPVILRERSEAKDLRTESLHSSIRMRRFLDSFHSLGMTYLSLPGSAKRYRSIPAGFWTSDARPYEDFFTIHSSRFTLHSGRILSAPAFRIPDSKLHSPHCQGGRRIPVKKLPFPLVSS